MRETFLKLVWPPLEKQFRERAHELLRAYAVRGLALSWLAGNVGDGLLLGLPEHKDSRWTVSVFDATTERQVATVEVDNNGEIITDAEQARGNIRVHPRKN